MAVKPTRMCYQSTAIVEHDLFFHRIKAGAQTIIYAMGIGESFICRWR